MARPIVVLLVLVLVVCLSEALRCRTEDGPSTEEIKKVVRTCMRRSSDRHQSAVGNGHGHAFDRSDYDDDDDSDDSYESDSTSADSRNSDRDDRNNNNHQRNHDNNHRHGQDTYDEQNRQNHQQQQQRTNFDPYQQQQQQQGDGNNYPYNNRYGMVRSMINRRSAQMHNTQMAQTQRQLNHSSGISGGHDSGAHHMTGMYNNRGGNSSDNGNGSTTSDQQQQSSCMVQCFFQELKMTNRDGLPDKHKMLNIMTKDISDGQLREFYVDTIQECHRILEMDYVRDKCTFARNLVECLSERARSNCEDFQDSMLF